MDRAARHLRLGSDPTNDELADIPEDLFAPYRDDDPNITPLGRLLYGIEDTPG